jgi:2Fe-2S ferredoxin
MSIITVLPHEHLAPGGARFEAVPGVSLCQQLLDHGIDIEHACGMVAACTTCHVVVRDGFSRLPVASDQEDDMLDKAWGLSATSRLACQVDAGLTDLTIELPRYTINHARE